METADQDIAPTQTPKKLHLSWVGNGSTLFGVLIVNWLLTALTLGLYYPWAKARQLQYIYGQTRLNKENFSFHGTGNEMFKGFIKAVLLLGSVYAIFLFLISQGSSGLAIFFFYAALIFIIPIAIHGSYRYRMSRTSWRGIRFGYRGDRNTLLRKFLEGSFLTIITLGFYGPFLTNNIRTYVWDHVRFGHLKFSFNGNGTRYFVLVLGGYFLSLITLGIYSFWWMKSLFSFYIDNLEIRHDNGVIRLKSTAKVSDFFELLIINFFTIVFTLGLGSAWVINRTMLFMTTHIKVEGDFDLDTLMQAQEDFRDATGDEAGDLLDIDFII